MFVITPHLSPPPLGLLATTYQLLLQSLTGNTCNATLPVIGVNSIHTSDELLHLQARRPECALFSWHHRSQAAFNQPKRVSGLNAPGFGSAVLNAAAVNATQNTMKPYKKE